jgi:hypothetical protein
MDGRELMQEMDAASQQVRLAHLQKLRDLGCSYASLARLNAQQHTIGTARVAPLADGTFDYADDGLAACLVAVVDHWREPDDAGVVDIIAFSPDDPSRWWLRTGAAYALGAHLLDLCEPILVVATPVEWLSHAGEALCILDWSKPSPAWCALRACPPLKFADDRLRIQLRNSLIEAAPLPQMESLDAA